MKFKWASVWTEQIPLINMLGRRPNALVLKLKQAEREDLLSP